MKNLLKEFQNFILKGNMLDMAVGIIIGAAFGTVVKSLVNNVIMPPIGLLLGGMDFSELALTIGQKELEDGAMEKVTLNYGVFINDIISLLIVGFCVFMLVRFYNQAKRAFEKRKEQEPEKEPEPSAEAKLLAEIRDLLAGKS